MANYNHAHYLKDSLPPIFSQTRPIDEVLIIDDASTDNSLEVLSSFQTKESRLRVIKNETNRGAIYSVNVGLREANGELVCFHSADDFLTPVFFELSVGMLEVCPIAGLCTSYFSHFRDTDKATFVGVLPWATEPTYLNPEELMRVKVRGGIPGHASIYDKQTVMAAGALIPELKWHCDWFMNHVIAARTGICFIPAPLSFFRMSPGGSYSSGRGNWEQQREVVKTILALLFSPAYEDVVPFFQGSAIMSHLYGDVARLLIEEPTFLTSERIPQVVAMFDEGQQLVYMEMLNKNKILAPELYQILSQSMPQVGGGGAAKSVC